ncbi:uncharacterized protein LOC115631878 [Scaptodrosophila lebanonensis]|uniref:Uncharacterized protein LOC115631878 n=1 Tax=Drosophila lebanonensis TaxID=7225 RepID=A0A6J2U7U5_DROLE|nr:uncharacterized protein LOC115631878 [Scaptodrosophila lebanonensis]
MPNFNGAIIVHTLEYLKSPATLQEILMTIATKTEMQAEDLHLPVKETLEIGRRSGFLQKSNDKYFLMPVTFGSLMEHAQAADLGTLAMPAASGKQSKSKDDPNWVKETKPKGERKHRKKTLEQAMASAQKMTKQMMPPAMEQQASSQSPPPTHLRLVCPKRSRILQRKLE